MGAKRWTILTAITLGGTSPITPIAPAQTPAPAASIPTTAPTALAANADPQAILRGQNSTQAQRDEAARRLVLQQNPAAREALVAALSDATNRAAQFAAARAISSDPTPDASFVAPLLAMIGNDAALIDVAISALAGFADDARVRARLLELATDTARQQRVTTRISAIRAIGHMSDKPAAQTLLVLVTDEGQPPAIRNAAADALTEMTSLPGGRRDAAQWQRWWAGNANLNDDDFQRRLLEARAARLVRVQHRFDRLVREAQTMLAEVYQAAPEKSREQILLRYLRGGEAELRAVGVLLVQEDFKQNRPIPPAAREELRAMVGDSSSQVRVMVAQALFLLNDPGARDALLRQLAQERDPEVRAAMAEALVPLRDAAVVPALLGLLRDPSLEVAEVAARGLADDKNIAPLVRADAAMTKRVRDALLQAFQTRTGVPGTGALRVALIDALGALKDPGLADPIYLQLLRQNESTAVRGAALRALGKLGRLGEPDVANLIIQAGALRDQNEQVRMDALSALEATATFAHADSIYGVLRAEGEKPAIREKAWQVLQPLFNDAPDEQLTRWADRFRDEPDRRIEILQGLARRLTAHGEKARLAETQQNIGEELMVLSARAAGRGEEPEKIAKAEEADKYFESALAYYRERRPNDQDMQTSALLDKRMEALLTSKQYGKAAGFAESSIKINAANQDLMGPKLHNEVGRLRNAKQYNDAAKLIEAISKMTPPLGEPYASAIRAIESDVKQNLPKPQSGWEAGRGPADQLSTSGTPKKSIS